MSYFVTFKGVEEYSYSSETVARAGQRAAVGSELTRKSFLVLQSSLSEWH